MLRLATEGDTNHASGQYEGAFVFRRYAIRKTLERYENADGVAHTVVRGENRI